MRERMNEYFTIDGLVINGIRNLSPREAFRECKKGAVIVDLRRENETKYKSFAVPEVVFLTPNEILESCEKLPRNKPVIIADNSGLRSKEITTFLQDTGFENVANLIGGMFEWDRDKMPISVNNAERLDGNYLSKVKKPKFYKP